MDCWWKKKQKMTIEPSSKLVRVPHDDLLFYVIIIIIIIVIILPTIIRLAFLFFSHIIRGKIKSRNNGETLGELGQASRVMSAITFFFIKKISYSWLSLLLNLIYIWLIIVSELISLLFVELCDGDDTSRKMMNCGTWITAHIKTVWLIILVKKYE